MKTINIVSSSYPPEVSGGSNRVASISKVFEDNNYKVNVITLSDSDKILSLSKNTTIYCLKRKNISNIGFVRRALYEIVDTYKLTKKANTIENDLTIVSIPYMFLLPIYSLFGHKNKRIIDIRDLVWEYLPNHGIHKFIKTIISTIMYQSIKSFDNVTVTNSYEKNLIEKRIHFNNITVIHNGIDQEKYALFSNLTAKETKQCVISYIGCVGLAQNLMTLVKAIDALKDNNILVNIVGTGNKKDELEQYVNEHSIKNIIFHGQKPWQELQKIYTQTTILYAQLTKDYDSAVPSKLYEYTATGLPIIYGGVGESEIFMRRLENSICIEPDNIEKLVNTIKLFQKKNIKKSTKNQLLIKENFVRDNVNLQFLEIIIRGEQNDKII